MDISAIGPKRLKVATLLISLSKGGEQVSFGVEPLVFVE